MTIIWWFLRYGGQQTEFFSILGHFFALLPHQLTKKIKTLKKWKKKKKKKKKHLEISSIYTSVPKIMIICHAAPEIWHMTDVIFIFHLGLFLPSYPPNSPKNRNQKKKRKKCLEISLFYTFVTKIMIRWCKVPEVTDLPKNNMNTWIILML